MLFLNHPDSVVDLITEDILSTTTSSKLCEDSRHLKYEVAQGVMIYFKINVTSCELQVVARRIFGLNWA
jgi:hypothetical protein